jgi:hypothetical protein
MQLKKSLKEIFKTGADNLKGHARRIFMAKIVIVFPTYSWLFLSILPLYDKYL